MENRLRYYFDAVSTCNMCGSSSKEHKVLGRRLNSSQGRRPRRCIGITTTVVKCMRCEMIFTNPMPIPMDISDHYGVPPEEYWRSDYFEISENYFSYEISRLKTLMEIREGMTSLDIGAGLGKAMIALNAVGFDAFGIEPSEQFHERAISKMGVNPDRLKLGQIEQSHYEDESFDFITFGAVLEHLYNPSDSIEKALKWLKPNGIIHIEVPSSGWLVSKLVNRYYKLTMTDYVSNLSPMHEPYHLYEFSTKAFQLHAERLGYTVALTEYYVGETYLPKSLNFILRPYMRRTNQGMLIAAWLRKSNS